MTVNVKLELPKFFIKKSATITISHSFLICSRCILSSSHVSVRMLKCSRKEVLKLFSAARLVAAWARSAATRQCCQQPLPKSTTCQEVISRN
ncbi:hypothetical protein V6Z11_D09G140900 [Gossypium hirsutum]